MVDRDQFPASCSCSCGSVPGEIAYLRPATCTLVLLALISPALSQTLHPTDPVFLNTDASNDARNDRRVDVATDGSGTWVAVWRGVEHPVVTTFFARSTDGGATWSPPAMISPSTATLLGDAFLAKVVSTDPGEFTCVWHSAKDVDGLLGRDNDILSSVSSDGGRTWSVAVPVNNDAESDCPADYCDSDIRPTIAVNSMGQLVVAWESGAIFTASSFGSAGQSWTNPQWITGSGGSFPSIATDGDVHWVVAWKVPSGPYGEEDGDILVSRSTSAGQSWSGALPLNTDAWVDDRLDLRPSVASNGAGTWITAWEAQEPQGATTGTDYDLLFARSTDNGVSWSAPRTLNSNAITDIGDDTVVRIVGASSGRWIAVWESVDTLEGRIGVDGDILYAISFDDGETWTDPRTLNTDAGFDEDRGDYFPAITGDGSGNYVVAWQSVRGTPERNDWDILVTSFVLPLADDSQIGTGVEDEAMDQGSVGSGDDAQSEPLEENSPQLCGLIGGASLMAVFATFGIACVVRRSVRHQKRGNSRPLL